MENSTPTPGPQPETSRDLSTLNPSQIDTELAELHEQARRAATRRELDVDSLHRMVGDQLGQRQITEVEVVAKAKEMAEREDYDGRFAASFLARIAEADRALASAHELAEPLNAEYERRPWSRFFAVPGGHIHSSMYCSTCNRQGRPTRFGWLPDMSGRTEAECVAEHGALLCTVCFPSAPTEWTNHYEVEEARKRAASCPGSGTDLDREQPHRIGFYSGNWGTCPECRGRITVTGSGKLRKHRPATN